MKAGIMFHPRSPYAAICADVVVTNPPGTLTPHSHDFPRPTFQEDQVEAEPEANGTAADLQGIGIKNTIVETSSPSSSSSRVPSQNLSPTSPSSPDNDSSESQIELGGTVSSQAVSYTHLTLPTICSV